MLKEFTIYLKIENLAVDQVHKKKYTIQPGKKLTLGRSKEANIILLDENVSRTHARFRISDNALVIEDMKSGNGTFVNDEKVQKKEIKSGQLIVIGGFEISVSQVEERISDIDPDDIVLEEDISDETSPAAQGRATGGSHAADSASVSEGAEGHKLSIQSEKLNELNMEEGLKGEDPWEGRMDAKGIIDIIQEVIKQLIAQKLDFFLKYPFVGTPRNSMIMVGALTGVLSFGSLMLGGANILAALYVVFGAVIAVGMVYITAYVEDYFKKWMGASGGFKNYLRFGAVMNVISFPIGVVALIPFIGPLLAILKWPILIFGLYGFYVRFKPDLARFIVFMLISTAVKMGASLTAGLVALPVAVVMGYEAPQEKPSNNILKKMKGENRKALEDAMNEN